jgi:hypothetical protein
VLSGVSRSSCREDADTAYLVKGQHLARHLAAIVESDAHPVVDLESLSAPIPQARCVGAAKGVEENVRSRPRIIAPCQSSVVNGGAQMRRGDVATHHLALLVRRRHDCDWWLLRSSVKFQKIGGLETKFWQLCRCGLCVARGEAFKVTLGWMGPESKFGREVERLELPQLHAKAAITWSSTSHISVQATFVPHRPGTLEPHPHHRAHNSKIRQQKSTSIGNSQILTTSLTFFNHFPPPRLTTQAKWYETVQRLNQNRPFANAKMNRLRRHKTPCASFASRSSSSTSQSASLVTD